MKNSIFKRILTVILAFALIASPVAGSLLNFTASAATQSPFDRVSDHESIDYWKGYFSNGDYDSADWSNTISTQNAGAVWTDKSVFVPNSTITIDGVTVPVADTSINAFTHFEPAQENERYYYLTDAVVYQDAQGTPYTGATKPTGDGYYHANTVFSVTGGVATSQTTYVKTSPDALSHAERSGNGWVIPAGTGKHEIVGYQVPLKNDNKTETNRFTAYPKIKTDATSTGSVHSHHYSVAAGTSVYVTGLAAGTYTVTESDHSVYRVLTVNGNAASQATVTVTARQTSEVLFVNTLKGFGSLYITKEVVSDLPLPAHATAAEFDITVDVGTALAGKNYAAAHSGNAALTTVTVGADGKITGLTIKHGETIVIRDLPENTTAVVTEAQSNNYTPSYSSHNKAGEIMDNDGAVTIEKNASATVVVKNAYKPTPTSIAIDLEGTKNMDATKLTKDKTFTFLVEKYEGGNWAIVQSKTATVTAGVSNAVAIDFETLDLTFTEPGIHSYRIYEKQPTPADGITYDPTVYTFVVAVTDVNGQLTATVTGNAISGSGNAYTATVSFTNAYNTQPVVLNVKKVVVNDTKDSVSPAGYEFELYNANSAGAAIDLIDTVVTGENGYASFSWLVDKTDEGTHYYILKEKVPDGYQKPDADDTGWHYDTREILVKVRVIVNNETVLVEIDDNNGYLVEYVFTNEYKASKAEVSLEGIATKTLNGRDMTAGEFTFELKDANGITLAEGKNAAAQDGKAAPITFYKPGTTEKYVLTYEKVGTYHYKLSEVAGNKGGVDYTTRIFDMVVEVTDDGSGALQASYYFEDSTTQTVNFVNTYAVKVPTSIQLEATKKLTGGRPMLSSEFHFNVFEMTDDTFTVKRSDTAVATGSNIGAEPNDQGVAQATFQFSAIEYTQPGIYYYQISEVDQGSDWGITFDKTVYNVTVTVTDNLDGTITAAADKTATELVFTNEYEPAPIVLNITGDKLLSGRPMQAGEFEFALFEATVSAGGIWTAGKQVGQNVTNADNGDIAFPELTFDKAGAYYYIAKEIGGELGGVVYDDTQYRITVTVTDNHRGVLSAEAIIVTDEGELSQVVFNNAYAAAETGIELKGTKKLTGATLKDQQFTFELYQADDSFTAMGEALQSVTNTAAGAVDFANLRFTEAGIYKYIVVEKNDAQKNYIYDDTVWCVTVEVTDNGEGKLIAKTTIHEKDSVDAVSAFAFENTYKSDAPKTGDEANIALWLALLVLSGAGFAGVILSSKSRKRA